MKDFCHIYGCTDPGPHEHQNPLRAGRDKPCPPGCDLQNPHVHQVPPADDPINQTLKINATLAKIPTAEQHKKKIRLLWTSCIIAAITIFFVVGGLVLALFLMGYDSKKIVEVSTTVFQVLILSYGMGFFVPCLMTSIMNMWLGIEMSRVGLELGQQSAEILGKVDQALDSRLKRIDGLLEKAEAVVDHPEDHPIVQKFEKAMLDIRAEAGKLQGDVKRVADAFSRPIKAPPATAPAQQEEKTLVHAAETGPGNGQDLQRA